MNTENRREIEDIRQLVYREQRFQNLSTRRAILANFASEWAGESDFFDDLCDFNIPSELRTEIVRSLMIPQFRLRENVQNQLPPALLKYIKAVKEQGRVRDEIELCADAIFALGELRASQAMNSLDLLIEMATEVTELEGPLLIATRRIVEGSPRIRRQLMSKVRDILESATETDRMQQMAENIVLEATVEIAEILEEAAMGNPRRWDDFQEYFQASDVGLFTLNDEEAKNKLESIIEIYHLLYESEGEFHLRILAQKLMNLVDADGITIMRFDQRDSYLEVGENYQFQPRGWKTEVSLGQGVVGRTAEARKAILASIVEQQRNYLIFQDVASELCCPLIHEDNLLGFMLLTNQIPDYFCFAHLVLLNIPIARVASTIADIWKWKAEIALIVTEQILHELSHYLKSPITSLRGFASQLTYSDLPEKQKKDVQTVYDEVRILENMVDDILDLGRIEAGLIEIGEDRVVLQKLVGAVEERARLSAEERSVNIEIDVQDAIAIKGDMSKLIRAIYAIVDNAMKFGHGGIVRIRVYQEYQNGVIEVQDQGPGIPTDAMDRIFYKFWRGSIGERGLGLGLAYCKGIIEAHGGEIEVSNAPEGGAIFRVKLPLSE